jgi:hypothetical protein
MTQKLKMFPYGFYFKKYANPYFQPVISSVVYYVGKDEWNLAVRDQKWTWVTTNEENGENNVRMEERTNA